MFLKCTAPAPSGASSLRCLSLSGLSLVFCLQQSAWIGRCCCVDWKNELLEDDEQSMLIEQQMKQKMVWKYLEVEDAKLDWLVQRRRGGRKKRKEIQSRRRRRRRRRECTRERAAAPGQRRRWRARSYESLRESQRVQSRPASQVASARPALGLGRPHSRFVCCCSSYARPGPVYVYIYIFLATITPKGPRRTTTTKNKQ